MSQKSARAQLYSVFGLLTRLHQVINKEGVVPSEDPMEAGPAP